MKRRNFIQALLGAAVIAPLLPLIAREETAKGSIYTTEPGASLYLVGDGRFMDMAAVQAAMRERFADHPVQSRAASPWTARVTEVDLKNKTFTVDTV